MLQQTHSERYWQLIEAGYKPEQILTCLHGDPCWCELSIRHGKGYVVKELCGLSSGKSEAKGGQ